MSDELKQFNAVGDSLKQARQPYEATFRELGDSFSPQRSRFVKGKDHRVTERMNRKLVNGRPRMALRTLQSGMHSGITSPARPWFRLVPDDLDHRQQEQIKEHFSSAQRAIHKLLQRSGLYTVLHTLWADLGLYGYDVAVIEDDHLQGLYGQALVPGEAWIGANGRGMVDTLYREVNFTVQQVVGKFVFHNDPNGDPEWDRVSRTVRKMWDEGNITEHVPTRQLIMPRNGGGAYAEKRAENKPIMSVYWEDAGDADQLMGDRGYDENPIVASRWDAQGTDIYGMSPAMDALADAHELQRKERDKAEAVRRMNRPPMNLPTEMRNSPFSMMPEAVNFMSDPSNGAVPAYRVQPPINDLLADIDASERRIDEAMYANLFLMIANLDRRQITAREIDERHEEKLLGLGPVLERQHREKLSVLLRRCYATVVRNGQVAPLPLEFDQLPVRVDYISTLGQAMKAVATGGIERLYGFVGNVSATDSSALDKLDNDVAIDEYAEMIGVPTNVVRSDDDVKEMRAERQKQVAAQQAVDQAQQMVETVGTGAQAAKVLSEADMPRGQGSSGILQDLGLTRGGG